jgi:hypothetical protein
VAVTVRFAAVRIDVAGLTRAQLNRAEGASCRWPAQTQIAAANFVPSPPPVEVFIRALIRHPRAARARVMRFVA